jgi:hypothetical protein
MISILTPSRSRPALAKRMMESAFKSPGCVVDIMFFLNDDDPMLADYLVFLDVTQYVIGPNQSTCYSWNLMANNAKYDILFLVGDDAQFTNDNWGVSVIEAFDLYPDKIVCVYPRAPSVSKKKNPHFCLHKNWIEATGFFLPPHFYHWYVDTWIAEVARGVGRYHLLPHFEMPIENIGDSVSKSYHHSWMKERDAWMWGVTDRYRQADIAQLQIYIENEKNSAN